MTSIRVRAALALVVAAVSLGGYASAAQALNEQHYGGFVLAPQIRYQAPVFHNFTTGNIAAYEGSGSVSVCQDTLDTTVAGWHTGCAVNGVGNALNLMPYYGHQLWPHIRNNSAWDHTIDGWQYWN